MGQTTCPKIIRDVHLWGQNIKQQQQQQHIHNFGCLYSIFANHHYCVVLQFSVRWSCPKFMYKTTYTQIPIYAWSPFFLCGDIFYLVHTATTCIPNTLTSSFKVLLPYIRLVCD